MIRFFDILLSLVLIILLLPFFIFLSILIFSTSRGGVFYSQYRIGKNFKPFILYKFRSMYISSDVQGLLTIGNRDVRITRVGFFIRKYKLDELPQLINVIKGDMSLVGPRPEVANYVRFYTPYQKKVLDVQPGITDFASIFFRNENLILSKATHPESYYIHHILPKKIRLSLLYVKNRNLKNYFLLLLMTIKFVFFSF